MSNAYRRYVTCRRCHGSRIDPEQDGLCVRCDGRAQDPEDIPVDLELVRLQRARHVTPSNAPPEGRDRSADMLGVVVYLLSLSAAFAAGVGVGWWAR